MASNLSTPQVDPLVGQSSLMRLPLLEDLTSVGHQLAGDQRRRVVLDLVTILLSRASECGYTCNDPSAGSPTETLLRLLLPLEI